MSTSPGDNDVVLPYHCAPHSTSVSIHTLSPNAELEVDVGGGAFIGSGSGTGWRDDSGDSGGDDFKGPDEELSALLRSRNAVISDIPSDILRAYEKGLIGLNAIANFLTAQTNIFSRILMSCSSGLRNRFLADRLFLLKIVVEEGIGVFGKLSAEYEQRRHNFWAEKEFVFANLLSALLADFALVYFPAPSVRLTAASGGTGIIARFKEACAALPTNVFQQDRAFTLTQRAAGFSVKAGQLLMVGFFCSLTSILFTNAAVAIRERFDPNYKTQTQKQNPLIVPALYGVFLGMSSNTRYQIVSGVETAIFPKIFRSTPLFVEQSATFGLRFGNTFVGSQQWCTFTRLTKAEKRKEE